MGGTVVAGSAETLPTSWTYDSRKLQPGGAFLAIVAARDGHDFVEAAIAAGASMVVVCRPEVAAALATRITVVLVDDTVRALQRLGRAVRQQSGARVVAITGSAGKTSTKEAIAALLEGQQAVVKNQGNLNNHIGLPLSLLELRHGADIAVMELGMNHAGEIRTLVGIAEPDVCVWTNVGDAHIGNFGSADGIAAAKAEILEGAGPETVFVANADDPRVMARTAAFPGRVITVGLSATADVRATRVSDLGVLGTRALVETPEGTCTISVQIPGLAQLSNVLCAMGVASAFGVPLLELPARIATLRPAHRRGEVHVLSSGVTVVDDSYNSSPSALRRSLEMLSHSACSGRRIGVLGEMLELGDLSESLHADCGRVAAASGLGLLVTVGPAPARALGAAAVAAGLPASAWVHADSSAEAASRIGALVRSGDLVLVKGSRGTRTDLVVDRLLETGV
jgi:UDP-N-acetylmuramoyl-tripeptide--D-alanyl-D-alanine ligase